jgi:hypothetical protein
MKREVSGHFLFLFYPENGSSIVACRRQQK